MRGRELLPKDAIPPWGLNLVCQTLGVHLFWHSKVDPKALMPMPDYFSSFFYHMLTNIATRDTVTPRVIASEPLGSVPKEAMPQLYLSTALILQYLFHASACRTPSMELSIVVPIAVKETKTIVFSSLVFVAAQF